LATITETEAIEDAVPMLLLIDRVTTVPAVGEEYNDATGPLCVLLAGTAPVPKFQAKVAPGSTPVEVLMNVMDCPWQI
jgi:hypothetical protein